MVDAVIRLFPEDATSFITNGIGYLPDTVSCEVKEERNGEFVLTLEYPITGRHYDEIKYRSILVAKPNPYEKPQSFRVKNISRPMNGVVMFEASHISYDMSGYPVKIFEANSPGQALQLLKTNSVVPCPFEFWTNVSGSTNFIIDAIYSMRKILGSDSDRSILSVYGGEYEFDNYSVKLHQNRGENRGFTILYGKNLTDLTQDEDGENVYTGVMPFWQKEENGSITTVFSNPEVIKISENPGYENIYILDCTSFYNEQPSPEDLKTEAEFYIEHNNLTTPAKTISVSFADLASAGNSELLKNLEQVKLCDTVTVSYEKLGVKASLKCIETVYDVINDRYTSLTLGDPKTDLATTVVRNRKEASDNIATTTDNFNYQMENQEQTLRNEISKSESGLHILFEKVEQEVQQTNEDMDQLETTLRTEISVTAEGIRSDVSKTYETKEEAFESYDEINKALTLGLETTTKNLQTQINQTAEEITTHAEETYETKKQSALYYKDLENAIATTEKTVTENYQTDISQTAKEITTNVAATYETKNAATAKYDDLNKTINTKEQTITENYTSAISQSANNITTSVAATYETKTAADTSYANLETSITQTETSILQSVAATYQTQSNAESSYESLSTSIEQTTEKIESKVSKGDVSSQISQEADQITINGNRLVVDSTNFKLNGEGAVSATGEFTTTDVSISGSTYKIVVGQGRVAILKDDVQIGLLGPYNMGASDQSMGIGVASDEYVAITDGENTGYVYDPKHKLGYSQPNVFPQNVMMLSGLQVKGAAIKATSYSGVQAPLFALMNVSGDVVYGHIDMDSKGFRINSDQAVGIYGDSKWGYIFDATENMESNIRNHFYGITAFHNDIALYGSFGLSGNIWATGSVNAGAASSFNGNLTVGSSYTFKAGSYTIDGNEIKSNTGFHAMASGNVYCHGGGTYSVDSAGTSYTPVYASEFSKQSVREVKENIEDFDEDESIEKLRALRVVHFDYINGKKHQTGMIYDEVYRIMPETCTFSVDDDGNEKPFGLDYSSFVPDMIKTMQSMWKRMTAMEKVLQENGLMA